MISAEKEEILTQDEVTFDTYEIDNQILKIGEYTQKTKGKKEEIKNKFKHLPSLTKEQLENKDPNSDFPKYFAKIDTKNFKYIGVLSNQLKRVQYGYSKMENEDEFLGEYKNELRDGFGIYKYHSNEEEQDIYIGYYKNNQKTGQGIYLKVFKSVKDEQNGDLILINFNCGIGGFENDIFKGGKIFSVNYDKETLYQGKINEIGYPSDTEGIVFEGGDKIFIGKLVDGELIEGRNIFVDEKWGKKKAYYFTKTENKENPYNFDLNKNEEQDNEKIKMMEKSLVKTYKNLIQNIFKDVNDAFEKFKNFDIAINFNFEKEIKLKIMKNIDIIIKD
jgi:hypothetical protein